MRKCDSALFMSLLKVRMLETGLQWWLMCVLYLVPIGITINFSPPLQIVIVIVIATMFLIGARAISIL